MMLTRIIAARAGSALFVLLAISVILFTAVETLPGDFASATAPRFTTGDQIEFTREEIGLNAHPVTRYVDWVSRAVRADFGISWYTRQPIAPMLAERIGNTALLALFAAVMAIPLGFLAAIGSVIYRKTLFDRGATIVSLAVISMPEFLIAYLLMTFLVVTFPIFPAHTVFFDDMALPERLHAMVLPAASLAIVAVAPVLRLTRASLINVLAAEYIEAARLKGLPMWRIVLVHALPNALPPIINMTVLVIANFLFGAFIVEQIFSYPGIGNSMIAAVKFRDIPLVLAIGMVFAAFFVGLNLLADIASILVTPRARFPVRSAQGFGCRRPAPGLRKPLPIKTMAVVFVAFALVTAIWRLLPETEVYPQAEDVAAPSGMRDKLQIAELSNVSGSAVIPVHYDYFLPIGSPLPAHPIAGHLTLHAFRAERRYAFDPLRSVPDFAFPELQLSVFSYGETAIPVQRDIYLRTSDSGWQVIFSAGRVWSEATDIGWSRMSLPFTLVRSGRNPMFNGALTLGYRDGVVTNAQIQIGQEGMPDSPKSDIWGQAKVTFRDTPISDRETLVERYQAEREGDFPVAPWHEFEDLIDQGRLRGFDNDYIRNHVSISGLLVDGTIYLRSCQTRFGPYPFCDRLRHPVASVSKSLGGAMAMLRLAEKYGPEVFGLRILDYVPLRPRHDGWQGVTFGHALDMSTGIGNLIPRRVEEYVETDFAPMESQIWNARDVETRIRLISDYRDYPWPPGQVLRYKSSETMLLAIAMDRLIRSREGDHYGLWEMLVEEVYRPLGIGPIPTRMMYDGPGRHGVPQFGGGMHPNIQEALKLAQLLANNGVHQGQQVLHREMTGRALSTNMQRGLPSWFRYEDGGMANYDMSFWLAPFQNGKSCAMRIPMMVGYGGNYVIVMPNGTIGFRFADGRENIAATYDSLGIRAVSNAAIPFCN